MTRKEIVILITVLWLVSTLVFAWLWRSWDYQPGGDFRTLMVSGQAANRGENPYGIFPLTAGHLINGVMRQFPNTNPPIILPALRAAAGFNIQSAYGIWSLFSIICFALCLLVLALQYRQYVGPLRIGWFFCGLGLWQTLIVGQIYMPLILASAIGWVLLARRRYVLAGIIIGLIIAVRPILVLWPVMLLLSGHKRVALPAFGSTAVISLVPVALYGPGVYFQWLGAATDQTYGRPADIAGWFGMQWLGVALSVAILAALGCWALTTHPSLSSASETGIMASLLTLPWTGAGYVLFLLPAFYSRRWSLGWWLAALLLILPPLDLGLSFPDADLVVFFYLPVLAVFACLAFPRLRVALPAPRT